MQTTSEIHDQVHAERNLCCQEAPGVNLLETVMSEEEIRKEYIGYAVLFTVVIALFGGYGWWQSARTNAIIDCMDQKGSVHSEIFYTECVYELS